MRSVLQDWVMELSLREQGTILCAVRGCDTIPKRPYDHPARLLPPYLRWCTIVPADLREVDIPGSWFRSIAPSPHWKASDLGHLPEHFYSHLMHAFEVVAYRHPNEIISTDAFLIYTKLVTNLHLNPETLEQYDVRMTEDRIANDTVVS